MAKRRIEHGSREEELRFQKLSHVPRPELHYAGPPSEPEPEDAGRRACAYVLFALPAVIAVLSTYHTIRANPVVILEMLFGVPLAALAWVAAVVLMPRPSRWQATCWWLAPWLAGMALIIWNGAHCGVD